MNIIDLVILDKRSKAIKSHVYDVAKKTLELLNIKSSYLEIAIVSQEKIKYINNKYRHHNKKTNVLSFEAIEQIPIKNKKHILGEIFLSNGFIRKHKQSINHMVVHGILHLVGFDHIDSHDRIVMEKKEKEILDLI